MKHLSSRLGVLFLALIICTGWGACQSNPLAGVLITKGAKEREVAALRADYENKAAANQVKADAAKAAVAAAKDAQIAAAGTSLYSADLAFKTIPAPTRTDLIINNHVTEAWTKLGRPMPSYEQMEEAKKRLVDELNETKTTVEQLRKTHDAEVQRGQQLADSTAKAAQALTDLLAAQTKERDDFRAKLDAAQTSLATAQNAVIAANNREVERDRARAAQLAKLSWGAGIIAALCLAGAIWSPISKRELAIAAAVFGGAAVALPFVEPLHVLIAVGLAAAAIVAWMLVKHRKDEKLSDALSLAMQDAKDHASEAYAKIAPFVEDRLKRYTKKGGKIVTERDHALEDHMTAKLAEFDALPSTTH